MKEASHERLILEDSTYTRDLETQSGRWWWRGVGGENAELFNGIEFQFCKMKSSRDWLCNNVNVLNALTNG